MTQTLVPLKNIKVPPGRGRKQFTRIAELSESLKLNGFIHPMCVTTGEEPGTYILIAGERRFRAAILAGFTEVPITFREDVSDLDRKIMELEENICRSDVSWAEQAETIAQIAELKQKEDGWSQKQTAEYVQQSEGHVSLQINIAKKLRANPELKEKIKNLPIRAAMQVIERQEQVEKVERLTAAGQMVITTDLILTDCLDGIKNIADDSIDLLLTDPPYGIQEMEDLRTGGSDKMTGYQMMSAQHNLSQEEMIELLQKLAGEFHRVLKPGAHFYVFSAMQYVGSFISALSPLEFQPPVLVWDRGKPTTPGYGYNYLNRTETIIYGHNPPRSRRLAKNTYNILSHPEVPRSMRMYPTEKPQSLLKQLIQQSTVEGDVVLDPFAGSASCLKAAYAIGRTAVGFEIDSDTWKRAQLSLSEVGDE